MVEYIKQIDDHQQFYLPLIDLNNDSKIRCNSKLPLSFYKKYEELLKNH